MKKIITITAASAVLTVLTVCVPGAYAMRDRQVDADHAPKAEAAQQQQPTAAGSTDTPNTTFHDAADANVVSSGSQIEGPFFLVFLVGLYFLPFCVLALAARIVPDRSVLPAEARVATYRKCLHCKEQMRPEAETCPHPKESPPLRPLVAVGSGGA